MVFTSIPAAYLEAAANWQQHHHQQQQQNHQPSGNTGGSASPQLLPPPPPPPPQPQPHGAGGGAGSIRPGSMADRARMANIPMPEAALRCPRCESTNTKFCYFNNYSLSQPRHFCKTCRRYWTRGGALRNVPVGGGCRRNKRSKGGGGGSSRSPAASSDRQTGSASSTNSVSSNSTGDIMGLGPSMPPLRFMAPLHHHQLSDFATGGGTEIPLNYNLMNYTSSISGSMGGVGLGDLSFQIGNPLGSGGGGGGGSGGGGSGGGSSLLSGLEQWRIPQQFPFMAGLEGSSHGGGLYPFEGGAEIGGYVRPKVSTSMVLTQLASVKMEDSRELNNNNVSSGQFLMGSIINNNNNNVPTSEQYWNNGAAAGTSASASWTELSGFSSSSTTSNNQL
ncbi:hypothetical protein PIB30_022202 [Stylosanthes scabra]|uniref:Dof zinc finger protein n=1 Tax=Stylosanthes scabra TaxID=79078 RepID=A0ABU6Y946_9FABA|nr:hypothetical protein [Stylosanthes scabra]